MNGPKARIVLLAIAITAAVAAFAVRGRPGIARVAAAPVESPGGSAAPILVEQDALYRAVRVARAVEGHGWVSAREDGLGPALLAEGAPPASENLGAPIPWAPGYDLFLAAVHRRAFPSFAQLLADESERAPAPAPDAGERARIERWVAAAPPLLAALTALLAALLAALVTPGAGASAAAAVAGLGVAFATAHVDATARGSGSAAGWVGLLLTGALLVTVRGWMQPRINQPFWSSVRGGIAGLLAGLAVASDAAALLPVALLQLTFLARLLLPFRDAEGRAVPARSFPVFVTSFHKVALLVLLPATVENPFVAGDPMGVVGVTWLPLALLGAGWLAFAPFALVPRLVGRRPVMALIPAALLAGAVLLGTDAPARVASLLDTERWSSPLALSWLVALPAALLLGGTAALRRPELAPLLFVGLGLVPLSGCGGVEAAWAVAPAAVLLAALLVPLVLRRLGGAPAWAAAAALGLCMVLAAAHPGTLAPDPPEAATDRSLDPSALETFIVAIEGRDSPRAALNDPSLGPLLLWRSDVAPSSVGLGAGTLARDGSDLEEPRDVLLERALRAGYGWTLDLPPGGASRHPFQVSRLER